MLANWIWHRHLTECLKKMHFNRVPRIGVMVQFTDGWVQACCIYQLCALYPMVESNFFGMNVHLLAEYGWHYQWTGCSYVRRFPLADTRALGELFTVAMGYYGAMYVFGGRGSNIIGRRGPWQLGK